MADIALLAERLREIAASEHVKPEKLSRLVSDTFEHHDLTGIGRDTRQRVRQRADNFGVKLRARASPQLAQRVA